MNTFWCKEGTNLLQIVVGMVKGCINATNMGNKRHENYHNFCNKFCILDFFVILQHVIIIDRMDFPLNSYQFCTQFCTKKDIKNWLILNFDGKKQQRLFFSFDAYQMYSISLHTHTCSYPLISVSNLIGNTFCTSRNL